MGAQVPPAEKPTFSSSVRLVVETVVVTDPSGNTITGLTAKDFPLTEDGKEQTVAFAEFNSRPMPGNPLRRSRNPRRPSRA